MLLIPVHGTWALREETPWWKRGSDFHKFALDNGFDFPEEPFFWSSDVNGLGLASLIGMKTDANDWDAGAFALGQYLRWFAFADINLICHSHGLQLALRCKKPIRSVTSIGSPIREETNTRADRDHIKFWQHIFEKGFDRMQWLGEIGDGRFGGGKEAKHADINHPIKGISHSKTLRDQPYIQYWLNQGWFDAIRVGANENRTTS